MRGRSISASLSRAGAPVPALTDSGFLFDRQRAGIGYASGQLYLQSAAGIHPAARFGTF